MWDKTKLITNYETMGNAKEKSVLKLSDQAVVGFGFATDWLKEAVGTLEQSQSKAKQSKAASNNLKFLAKRRKLLP